MKSGLLRYEGSKARGARELIALRPLTYSSYCEPFAGSAAIFWKLRQNVPRWLNDLDPHVTGFYKWFRDCPDSVDRIRDLIKTRLITADDVQREFVQAKFDFVSAKNPADRALAYLVLNRFSYGQFVAEHRPNIASLSWHHLRNGVTPLTREHLTRCKEMLQGVKITRMDFSKLLTKLPDDCWTFIDPPYYQQGHYDLELSIGQHEQLRDILKKAKFKFLLTIAYCPYAKELYASGDFKSVNKRKFPYTGNMPKDASAKTELIIRNYK